MKAKKILLTILCVACVSAISLGLVACNTTPSNDDNNQKEDQGMSFVTLDINPSIEIIVDGENKVASVYGSNEDGMVLLYNETGIVGEDVETAIDKIISLAVEMGYLSEDNKTVDVSVSSEKEATGTDLTSKVNAKITATAKNLGLNVTTTAEGAYSDLKKLEELKAEYPDNPAIQALDIAKFKLVTSATEDGTITVEAAVELDDSALIAMVNDAHSKIEAYATDAYKEAVAKANEAYEWALEIAKDSAYIEFYATNVLKYPTEAYYGCVYYMYSLTASGFDLVANVFDYIEAERNYPLDEARVSAILESFGMDKTEVDKLKNADGEVTIASVEAYIDKMVKNTSVYGDFTEVKAEVEATLEEAKTYVNGVIDEAKVKYADQIESYIAFADTAVNAVKATIALVPGATEMLESSLATYNQVVDQIKLILEDGVITSDELRDCSAQLEAKANDYANKITSSLTEEDLATIASIQERNIAKLNEEKATFDTALETAKNEAQTRLQNLKDARLGAQTAEE